jgi:hypothetical protein
MQEKYIINQIEVLYTRLYKEKKEIFDTEGLEKELKEK